MHKDTKEIFESFTSKAPALTLSTCNLDGQPQSSLVYYAIDEQLNIYFISTEGTHKSKNIRRNTQVALITHNLKEQLTLQIEGEAEEILDTEEKNMAFDLVIRTLSGKVDWPLPISKIDAGKLTYYKVKIAWARLGEFKLDSGQIFTQLIP